MVRASEFTEGKTAFTEGECQTEPSSNSTTAPCSKHLELSNGCNCQGGHTWGSRGEVKGQHNVCSTSAALSCPGSATKTQLRSGSLHPCKAWRLDAKMVQIPPKANKVEVPIASHGVQSPYGLCSCMDLVLSPFLSSLRALDCNGDADPACQECQKLHSLRKAVQGLTGWISKQEANV